MKYDLVIFDCDGVLVDTENISNQQIARVLSERGPAISAHECRSKFQGKTLEDVCLNFNRENGFPDDPHLPGIMRDTVENAMSSGIKAIAGVVSLVERLVADKVPICVASSGSISKMHKTLGQTGLLPVLKEVLFSAQDFGRGKPHPDIFLAAASAMGFACENAVIIEDSVSGVQAGVAAGAKVLGYAGDPFTDAAELEKAGAEVFGDMSEACNLIYH